MVNIENMFGTGINKIINDDSALVAVGVHNWPQDILTVFQITKAGKVTLHKTDYVSGLNISVKDDNIVAITDGGTHQISLNSSNVFTDSVKTPIQVGEEKSNSTKLSFAAKGGIVIPDTDKTLTVKVGSTVTFVESTGKPFSIYTNGFYKDEPVGIYGTYYLNVPYFTFNETGKVDFIIDTGEGSSDHPPPIYSINVVQ
ncbi:hypothetical protein [Desulfosporosinus shakirovi]|uniref:hypothetical protein n=1 Tax=Desulfosporosinus shakirovi TaxID=2885154 RepID=UPI001E5398E9|nr:hypothetical protein [Desulfosporosinus sp. SRJS8]MCB8817093.1 hypothetical protein [Desulfosporosinus sp. SRJS8]